MSVDKDVAIVTYLTPETVMVRQLSLL